MTPSNPLAAQLLETSASAYAAYATNLLFERHPEVEQRLAPTAFRTWKAHLTQRILDLAAALAEGEAQLFVSGVNWARRAFRAREVSDEDLRASLACLRDVLGEELPQNARDEPCAVVDRALEAWQRPAVEEVGLDPAKPEEKLALNYLRAALEGDPRRAIDHVVEAVDQGLSIEDAYLKVLLPAQREVGRMWHLAELSVAEEHFVTVTTRRVMVILCHRAEPKPPTGKTVIAAAVAGNQHDVGIWAAADFFEMAGWRAVGLGADVPAADVAAVVTYFDADLVLLSAALSTQLKAVREAIEALRGLSDRDVKILVGGLAFAESPELWRRLGADGYAPAADAAVACGTRLVELDSSKWRPEGGKVKEA